MSFNWLLIWTVAISCLFMVFSMWRSRVRQLIYYMPAAIVGGILFLAYKRNPETAGYYAGVVWFTIILLPGMTAHASSNYLATQRYKLAYLMSLIAWISHPWGGTKDQIRLVNALQELNRGRNETAISLLESLRLKRSAAGRTAFIVLTKLQGRWMEFLDVILKSPHPRKLLVDPLFRNMYLQALGETGQTERLIQDFNRLSGVKAGSGSGVVQNVARLNVAAFSGRADLVALLLDGPLGHFDLATRKFWLATAMQAAGRVNQANIIFAELGNATDRQIAVAANSRLQQPVRNVIDLSSEHISQSLTEIEASVDHENRFALINSIASVKPLATYLLMFMLVVMFVFEMFHGETGRVVLQSNTLSLIQKFGMLFENTANGLNLVEMGALVLPVELTSNPLESVVKSAFMHLGVLHLLMNMAGLWIFGPRLEEAWGKYVTFVAYLICAIFSVYLMTVIPLDASLTNSVMLVGASGGVMGLIGCLLGYLGWGQLLRRNRLVGSEFNLLFTIVIIQTIFDQSTPAISSECHLLGLMIGTTIGFLVGVAHSLKSRLHTFSNRKPRTKAA
ncbi:rhomboid family intramembrane serine protease [Planctomicrobium sp.]|nr:rhomboid family intramembrane serine protease [Planctomicrobium sp.]MDB4732874.1 rhomboid family intramembrane serine protease [Planctomicrobium sp.]